MSVARMRNAKSAGLQVGESYALAIDGGQSSTTCLVGSLDGTALGLGIGGPISHIGESGGPSRLERALGTAILSALAEAGLSLPQSRILVAYLSLTSCGEEAANVLRTTLLVERLVVDSDAVGALASGRYGRPGIGLVAGTGTCAIAIGPAGERVIRGGWGHLLGDEGGGYWIGLSGLRAAIRASEGRGPQTVLRDVLADKLKLRDLHELFNLVYEHSLDKADIARLAPIIMETSVRGDTVSTGILDQAANELVSLVEVTAKAATFLPNDARVVVSTGGVLQHDGPLWTRFATVARQRLEGYQVIRPDLPEVAGAYLLALRLSGVDITTDILERLHVSLGRLGSG